MPRFTLVHTVVITSSCGILYSSIQNDIGFCLPLSVLAGWLFAHRIRIAQDALAREISWATLFLAAIALRLIFQTGCVTFRHGVGHTRILAWGTRVDLELAWLGITVLWVTGMSLCWMSHLTIAAPQVMRLDNRST
jgi:hypothetical protein